MNRVNFNISKWTALSPGLTEPSAWVRWAENDKKWPVEPEPVPANLIPAMMRRRMSTLSKLAVQTAMTILQEEEVNYIVFSSRHGELSRTVKLMSDILKGEDASPFAFSQSVHNTAAGLFTIAVKQMIPVTSLGAGDNTLHAALIEASAYVAENPTHKVLLVDFDEPVPEPYTGFEACRCPAYALGMVLSAGDGYQLSWETLKQDAVKEPLMVHPSLAFGLMENLLNKSQNWSLDSSSMKWNWTR